MEDEIDIDGDDVVVYGDRQFTEKDIIVPASINSTEDEEIIIESEDEDDSNSFPRRERVGTSLRDLVAQGKVMLKSDAKGVTASAIVSTVSLWIQSSLCSTSHQVTRILRPWGDLCVAFVLMHTQNQLFLLAVGIPAARNVGCGVSGRPNCVQFVNVSQQ